MKVNIVEKECVARVGLAIEFSNSECSSIERVANKLNDAVEKSVEQAKTIALQVETRYADTTKVSVLIDLETAMRVSWILGQMCHKTDSALFANADNTALVILSEINGDQDELNNGGE